MVRDAQFVIKADPVALHNAGDTKHVSAGRPK